MGNRRGSRCQTPTETQLSRIEGTRSTRAVLLQLQAIASLLRQYRIHVRSHAWQTESIEASNIEWPASTATEAELAQEVFLSQYRQVLVTCLDKAIAQAVEVDLVRLKRKKPPQDQVFLTALNLFLCQGISMSAIASQIGYKNQVQVTRLIRMKTFRANVRHFWLSQLRQQVQELAKAYLDPERLQALDQTLDQLLAEQLDEAIERSQADAQSPQRAGPANCFDQHVCQYLAHNP
ncbi:MAG: hypothetical protein F6K04_26990 [Leptolyngbya sp. SIO4C5]|nr:hypothetical protein [Leptolyngbya sp. SIO4C5]